MSAPDQRAARVLLVEDEPALRVSTVAFLKLEGHQVHAVGRLAQAESWMRENAFDILLLDLGLPDGDGLEWLQKQTGLLDSKGVIITTARGTSAERVAGARAGSDAYLVKPISMEELSACISNLYRRLGGSANHKQEAPASPSWCIDVATWLLHTPEGEHVKLTGSEITVVSALARQPGVTMSRDELILALGYKPDSYDPRRMEILVRRLRNKVSDHTRTTLPLETVHRQGYVFVGSITLRNTA